jgi:ribosomal protein S27E
MTTYEPATPHSDSILRPPCAKCGTKTRLFGIEAEKPGYELLSFECPKCQHIQTAIGKAE